MANVSHELKTPVGAMALLAETLLDATELPVAESSRTEQTSEDLIAAAPVRRADPPRVGPDEARLVNELLELTRLQERRAAADPRAGARSTG